MVDKELLGRRQKEDRRTSQELARGRAQGLQMASARRCSGRQMEQPMIVCIFPCDLAVRGGIHNTAGVHLSRTDGTFE
jgi:hypothetical protein